MGRQVRERDRQEMFKVREMKQTPEEAPEGTRDRKTNNKGSYSKSKPQDFFQHQATY